MRNIVIYCIAGLMVIVLLFVILHRKNKNSASNVNTEATSKLFITNLFAQNYQEAFNLLDTEAQKYFKAPTALKAGYEEYVNKEGKFDSIVGTKKENIIRGGQSFECVTVLCKFEKTTKKFIIIFNDKKNIIMIQGED